MTQTITSDEIDSYMNDSENLANTKWVRDEMKDEKYYMNNHILHNDSMNGPKYFSDYAKLIQSIHDQFQCSWTKPLPVFGYMNEIVYIHPFKD